MIFKLSLMHFQQSSKHISSIMIVVPENKQLKHYTDFENFMQQAYMQGYMQDLNRFYAVNMMQILCRF